MKNIRFNKFTKLFLISPLLVLTLSACKDSGGGGSNSGHSDNGVGSSSSPTTIITVENNLDNDLANCMLGSEKITFADDIIRSNDKQNVTVSTDNKMFKNIDLTCNYPNKQHAVYTASTENNSPVYKFAFGTPKTPVVTTPTTTTTPTTNTTTPPTTTTPTTNTTTATATTNTTTPPTNTTTTPPTNTTTTPPTAGLGSVNTVIIYDPDSLSLDNPGADFNRIVRAEDWDCKPHNHTPIYSFYKSGDDNWGNSTIFTNDGKRCDFSIIPYNTLFFPDREVLSRTPPYHFHNIVDAFFVNPGFSGNNWTVAEWNHTNATERELYIDGFVKLIMHTEHVESYHMVSEDYVNFVYQGRRYFTLDQRDLHRGVDHNISKIIYNTDMNVTDYTIVNVFNQGTHFSRSCNVEESEHCFVYGIGYSQRSLFNSPAGIDIDYEIKLNTKIMTDMVWYNSHHDEYNIEVTNKKREVQLLYKYRLVEKFVGYPRHLWR